MQVRLRLQLAEALGPVNRWYCSQAYGTEIDDPELLMTYFIKSGGAEDFASRFAQAMGLVNRWYCSEHHRCDIRDPDVLWNYYMSAVIAYKTKAAENESNRHAAELSVAC